MVKVRTVLLTLAGAALVLWGLWVIGRLVREQVRSQPRYQFAVTDIDCEPPAGKTRADFLAEVHYYGQLPEKLNALDTDLSDRLRTAFAKHPKVERVEKVTVTQPNRVRVEVVFKK